MSDDLAVVAERLRDDLEALRRNLRKQYRLKSAQVQSAVLRREAAALAERGLVDLTGNDRFSRAVGDDTAADLTLEFQRLLNASGKSATRGTYEAALAGVLSEFASRIVIPLKRAANTIDAPPVSRAVHSTDLPGRAFLGHSFDPKDSSVVACVKDVFELLKIQIVTGERPRADRISDKVKKLIDDQPMFIGLYTRRDKVARKNDWTASPWVIEEKAYAVAKRKKLLLIKEGGISSIGGIQGDYEYIEFDRASLELMVLKILRLFSITVDGLAE